MSLQSVNLNLLPLMRALFQRRSVTLAAESLGITQSAASQGLARLRRQMNDPLLVRIGGRMQLTPLALSLMPRVESLAIELDDLFLPSRFDPAIATRTFVITANDYLTLYIGRPMFDLQRAQAPQIRIHCVEIGHDFADRMAAQEIDFALLPRFAVRDQIVAPLRYRALFAEPAVLLMDRAHPLAALSIIGEDDVAPFGQVGFHAESMGRISPGHWEPPPEIAAFSTFVDRSTIRTNHFMLIPSLICGTDFVSITPSGVGRELSRFWPVATRPLAFGPPSIEYGIAWSPVFDADPAHLWFRDQLATCLSQHQDQMQKVRSGGA